MELKLFGKSIFDFRSNKAEAYLQPAYNEIKESKYIIDFQKLQNQDSLDFAYSIMELTTNSALAVPNSNIKEKDKKEVKSVEKPKTSPKGVYDLKLLDETSFKLNTNEKYIDEQLEHFKDKLNLISSEEYDMRRGTEEVASMVMRLENRKKYPEVKDFFEQFAYTTSSKITKVLKEHDNLQLGQIAQFVADLPKEATQAMKNYNKNCDILCKKQAVFYIIADKKDFKKTDTRRDPILLAQSPFGHVWQILGAWDKEMMFLEEL